jgi:hypothetical protein
LEEEGRARRALAARNAWRRAFYRRTAGVGVLTLVVGLLVAGVIDRYGTRATLILTVIALSVLAGVGRAIRPRPTTPDAPEEVRGEEEPYPIADAHTRAEAANCVARAVRAEEIDLRMAAEARREPWGWTVPVILRRGLHGVTLLGDLPHDRLHPELARRRAYLHLPRWTSLGLSLIEAMQIGMPVVCLAATETVEAVPPGAGVLSTRLDVLAAGLRELMAEPERAKQMGKQAREHALRRFGLARYLADWNRLLAEATRQRVSRHAFVRPAAGYSLCFV